MRIGRQPLLALTGVLSFLFFAAVGLPAQLALRWLAPPGLQVLDPQGTLWQGSAAAVAADAVRLGPLSWSLSAAGLLTGHLRAEVSTRIGAGEASGLIEAGSAGRFACSRCLYTGPTAALGGLLPALRGTGGNLKADITVLEVRDRWPRRAVATLEFTGLPLRVPGSPAEPAAPVANFNISIAADPVPDDGRIEATVVDGGGPVQLTGQLVITPPGNYQLEASARARPEAPAQIGNALALLGPRAADGSTRVGMSGSF